MLRLLCIVLLAVGVFTTAYLAWSWSRFSDKVLMYDSTWPRPSPYPDYALLALDDWFDARYPARPGCIKLHGEIARVRMAICCALVISAGIAALGAFTLAWPWVRRLRGGRGFEVMNPHVCQQAAPLQPLRTA